MKHIREKWTKKYKRSIDCSHPRGFSQKAHCAARRARRAHRKTTSRSITESSPLTFAGSITRDLIMSKIWLCQHLEHTMHQRHISKLNSIYILGSWYGNMSMLLIARHLAFKKIINVDTNSGWQETSQYLLHELGFGEHVVQHMNQDANTIDYTQLKTPSLVINTSCNDIVGHAWFDHIPMGTMVALQSRDQVPAHVPQWHSLDQFATDFPLTKTLFADQIQLQDPEVKYTRYMIIGIK